MPSRTTPQPPFASPPPSRHAATPRVAHSSARVPVIRYLNPLSMARNLWGYRDLIGQLARRDVEGRYRAARLGLLWAVLMPVCLLAIYTFMFSVVLGIRWSDDPSETRGRFALTMFCGMLLYGLFSEVVNRAPQMVVSNPNYVKKVIFPLEVFVVSGLASALVNTLIGYGIWLVAWIAIEHRPPPWTMVWMPFVLLPVCLTTAGVAWVLASLGVFVRDVGHVALLATQMLYFATPVFYSLQRVPEPFRGVLAINPLTHAIEDMRRILIWDGAGPPPHPEWSWWIGTTALSSVLALLGYAFFMKSKRAFADVI